MQTNISRFHSDRYWLAVLGAALLGGGLLALLGMPAAWMLGPMAGVGIVASLYQRSDRVPTWIFQSGQAIVGGTIGIALTPAALTVFADNWLAIAVVVISFTLLSLVCGVLLSYITGLDLPTALLGMLPGGVTGVVALSEEMHAETRLVALMQTLRVLLVMLALTVFAAVAVPMHSAESATGLLPGTLAAQGGDWTGYLLTVGVTLLGAVGALRLRVPAGAIAGPAVLGTVVSLAGFSLAAWPAPVLMLAYMSIGVIIGLQFNVQALREAGRLLPAMLAASLLLILGCGVIGVLLALFTPTDPLSAYLATTPGGMNVVTILALESGANAVLVPTINLLRFLVVLIAGPVLVRRTSWLVAQGQRSTIAPGALSVENVRG